jgi:hypothetical protein
MSEEEFGTVETEYKTIKKKLDDLEIKHEEALRYMATNDGLGITVISIYENIQRICLRYLKNWHDMDWELDTVPDTTFYSIVERLLIIFQKTLHAYQDREMRHMRGSNLNGFVWSPHHLISSFNRELTPMLIQYEYDDMVFNEAKQIYKKTGGVEPSLPTSCNLTDLKTYAKTKAAFKMVNEFKQQVVFLNERISKLYDNKYIAYLNLNPDVDNLYYFFDTSSKVTRWEDPSDTEIRKKKRIEEKERLRKEKKEGEVRLHHASTKIKKVIKGYMTRISSTGKAVSKKVQRHREYQKSRSDFHNKYKKVFETVIGLPQIRRSVRSMPLTLKSKKNKSIRPNLTY